MKFINKTIAVMLAFLTASFSVHAATSTPESIAVTATIGAGTSSLTIDIPSDSSNNGANDLGFGTISPGNDPGVGPNKTRFETPIVNVSYFVANAGSWELRIYTENGDTTPGDSGLVDGAGNNINIRFGIVTEVDPPNLSDNVDWEGVRNTNYNPENLESDTNLFYTTEPRFFSILDKFTPLNAKTPVQGQYFYYKLASSEGENSAFDALKFKIAADIAGAAIGSYTGAVVVDLYIL